MASGMINPIYDPREAKYKRQLAIAESLRQQGQTDSSGAGYHGGPVFMVGTPWGKVAKTVGGEILNSMGNTGMGDLGQERKQRRNDFFGAMPSADETVPAQIEAQGPPQQGMAQPMMNDPTGRTTVLPKSSTRYAREMQDWAIGAPDDLPGVQEYALTQALGMPEKMALREQDAAARAEAARLKAIVDSEKRVEVAEAKADTDGWREDVARQTLALNQGKAADVQEARLVKREADINAANSQADSAIYDTEGIIGTIDQMVGNEAQGVKRHPGFEGAVGTTWNPLAKYFSGSDVASYNVLAEQVKSNARVEGVRKMKGAGAVSNAEGAAAAQASHAMDAASNEKQYLDAAAKYRAALQAGVDRLKRGMRITADGREYKAVPDDVGGGAAPAAPAQPREAPPAAIQYLQQHPETAPQFKAKFGYLPGEQ